ncbi:MAG: hypothetical protein AAF502_15045 [Bacteroidota bacterium]
MQIVFTKGKGVPDTMSFSRQDGSISLSPLNRGMIEHDIMHYAVETVLNFNEGFYGLLAKGYTLEDFAPPTSKAAELSRSLKLTQQVFQSEYIVGLLQMEQVDNKTYDNFIDILAEICSGRKTKLPETLNNETLAAIREKANALLDQWRSIQPSEKLEVNFPLT